ncbi:MAG: RNA-binding domain-containing protein [Candidatus Bathyarchaeia archaeon]
MRSEGVSGRIISLELSAIVHATENVEKVKEAILNILPPNLHDSITFKRTYLKGHYGNPIIVFSTRIMKEKLVKGAVEYLFKVMEPTIKQELNIFFAKYLDEDGNFYIRLDKQEAFMKRIKLASGDPIRVKIGIRMWRPTLDVARSTLRELGLIE